MPWEFAHRLQLSYLCHSPGLFREQANPVSPTVHGRAESKAPPVAWRTVALLRRCGLIRAGAHVEGRSESFRVRTAERAPIPTRGWVFLLRRQLFQAKKKKKSEKDKGFRGWLTGARATLGKLNDPQVFLEKTTVFWGSLGVPIISRS